MASSGDGFERLLDEYQYALTVEWDQKDDEFLKQKSEKFFDEMGVLLSRSEKTQEEMLRFIERKLNNKVHFEAIMLKISLLEKVQAKDQMLQEISEISKDMYMRGASWNGDAAAVALFGAVGIFTVVTIGALVWHYATTECVSYRTDYNCGISCDSTGYCFQNCASDEVCTERVKK